MKNLLLLILLPLSVIVYSQNIAQDELLQSQKSIMSKMASLPDVARNKSAEIVNTTIGYATIQDDNYPFSWMLFSGGWYWDTDDSYSSFYNITQKYKDILAYSAYFTTYIYKNPISIDDAADVVVSVGNSQSGVFINNKKDTTFARQKAFLVSYTYNSSDINFYTESYIYQNSGTTYNYQILTTYSDWSVFKPLYQIMELGFMFPTSTKSKQLQSTQPAIISYYPLTNGSIEFKGISAKNTIYIYNTSGQIVRILKNTTIWDGNDSNGNKVKTGVYVTNIKSGNNTQSLKILK